MPGTGRSVGSVTGESPTTQWYDVFPFTTHRFRVADSLFTTPEGVECERDERIGLVFREIAGSPSDASLIDLGCLEGGFALTFARRGIGRVVGVELREASVRRCRVANELMGLHAEFVHGDLNSVLATLDETFTIVFASGILYHFDDPATVLAQMRRICTSTLLLDTHVAHPDIVSHGCGEETSLPAPADAPYKGRWFPEFDPNPDPDDHAAMLWASAANPQSFWPYEDDLVRMVRNAGFRSAEKVTVANLDDWQVDKVNRVMYLCKV
jgi:SAM-dependent methyltransferase